MHELLILTRWIQVVEPVGDKLQTIHRPYVPPGISWQDITGQESIPPGPNLVLLKCRGEGEALAVLEQYPDDFRIVCDSNTRDGRFESNDRAALAEHLILCGVDSAEIDNAIGTRHQILKRQDVADRLAGWLRRRPRSDKPLDRFEVTEHGLRPLGAASPG